MKGLLQLVIFCLSMVSAMAQQPRNIPQPNGDPLTLDNWTNVVVFVALPLAVIILYVTWKRRKLREKEEKEEG